MNKVNFVLRRRLKIRVKEHTQKIEMVIGGLTREHVNAPWACKCMISQIMPKVRLIYGEDEIHALVNALQFCAATLNDFCTSNRSVWWLDPKDKGSIFNQEQTLGRILSKD